jgi:hypothetical protein
MVETITISVLFVKQSFNELSLSVNTGFFLMEGKAHGEYKFEML